MRQIDTKPLSTALMPRGVGTTTEILAEVKPNASRRAIVHVTKGKKPSPDVFFFFPGLQDIAETLQGLLPDTPAVSSAVYPRRPYSRGCHNEGEHFGVVIVTKSKGSYAERVYDFNQLLTEIAKEKRWYPQLHVYSEDEAEAAGGIDELAKAESAAFRRIYW